MVAAGFVMLTSGGECQWERVNPQADLKHIVQVWERQIDFVQPHTLKLPIRRHSNVTGGDSGGNNGHGDHTKNRGGFCEYSWGSWLQSRKVQRFLGP